MSTPGLGEGLVKLMNFNTFGVKFAFLKQKINE